MKIAFGTAVVVSTALIAQAAPVLKTSLENAPLSVRGAQVEELRSRSGFPEKFMGDAIRSGGGGRYEEEAAEATEALNWESFAKTTATKTKGKGKRGANKKNQGYEMNAPANQYGYDGGSGSGRARARNDFSPGSGRLDPTFVKPETSEQKALRVQLFQQQLLATQNKALADAKVYRETEAPKQTQEAPKLIQEAPDEDTATSRLRLSPEGPASPRWDLNKPYNHYSPYGR